MDEAAAIMRRQHGVISRRQALAAGLTAHEIKGRVRRGDWKTLHPGVYRHGVVRRSWHARLVAACLSTGGLASHGAAARLHGLESFGSASSEIVVPLPYRRSLDPIRLHQSTQFEFAAPTVIDGIPVTGLSRTLMDLGATVSPQRIGDAVDNVLRDRRLTFADLYDVLALHGGH
ncbi:MAG: hypothetical protein ACI8Y4_001291 [Candidatus Poriferisodalaceae bacterium]|jgi:hypothetical protein